MNPDIFSYIKEQESRFDTEEITVGENWNWNLKNHVQKIFHFKNDQFTRGENDWRRPFKNVLEPVLNLAYWSEDIEVKDIVFFIENRMGRILSFLIKKYHDEVYVKENDIDLLLDEITEDDVDYGGVLVQEGEERPEVMFLPSVAFADQTDMMGGPIGFKHYFSPEKLRQMKSRGWGDPSNGADMSIEELITLADNKRDPSGQDGQQENNTSGKLIEVYIVKGDLPEHYLLDNDNMEDWYNQVHIVGFYTSKDNREQGVTLFKKKETRETLKFHTSKKVYGRALGRGVGESLLHPQVWTNFLEIHKTNMLEAGSKVPLWTDDEDFIDENTIKDQENLTVNKLREGRRLGLVPTMDANKIQLFQNSVNEWFEQAQAAGSAFDPLLGKEQASGTTFRGQERVVHQGRGIHDRRRGQRAKFIEEIYRDWIIPDMIKGIKNGREFLATLTADEMDWMVDQLAENRANRERTEQVLNGQEVTDKEALKEAAIMEIQRGGNKRLFKILKDEFKDIEVKIGINIAGKQKDLALMSDKILSIFQFVFANPQGFQQAMQIPGMASAFNDILEFSGVSPIDFANITNLPALQPAQEAPELAQPEAVNETVNA